MDAVVSRIYRNEADRELYAAACPICVAALNDNALEMLIDGGSEQNLVREDVVRDYNIPIDVKVNWSVGGATGHSTWVVGVWHKVTVTLHSPLHSLRSTSIRRLRCSSSFRFCQVPRNAKRQSAKLQRRKELCTQLVTGITSQEGSFVRSLVKCKTASAKLHWTLVLNNDTLVLFVFNNRNLWRRVSCSLRNTPSAVKVTDKRQSYAATPRREP
ncbi:hypothetical protein BGX38DRAFT_1272770 [Terfezia claveryi]|nr:hypothetical protein BGX38DRAFT_1272770 [Terfezia claveryi]